MSKQIWHDILETARTTKQKFVALPNSTLNQKLGILNGATNKTPTGYYPIPQYLGIGRGGLQFTTGRARRLEHEIDDAVFFDQIPFIARPANADLSPADRSKYRLRQYKEVNGVGYFFYYLLKIDLSTGTKNYEVITKDQQTGAINTRPYTPTPSLQNPTPIVLTNNTTINASGESISISSKVPVTLGAQDIQEIMNVFTILDGNTDNANLSEFAICSGHEVRYSSTDGGVTAVVDEVIDAQIINFLDYKYLLSSSMTVLRLDLDIGDTLARIR